MSRGDMADLETLYNTSPIYRALPDVGTIGAAYTGRGSSTRNRNFSFHRPPIADPTDISKYFRANLEYIARQEGFDPRRVTLPNGAWPQSGQAIKAEDYRWVTNPGSQTIMPLSRTNQSVTYDAIATRSPQYVLGVQGADCPSVFLYDSHSQVIGLAHSGWKPVLRGVIQNVLNSMTDLGAKPQNIIAYISPGAGDRYNVFKWDDAMEPQVREVFVETGRKDLLNDRSIRHEMNYDELARLRAVLGREIYNGTSFKLSALLATELERCGVSPSNISRSPESTIVTEYSKTARDQPRNMKYHSYRREYPNHGLSMSILFLKPNVQGVL